MNDAQRLQSGQTIIFLGDHTSPDNPGYVRVIGDVLSRFQPSLRLNLISAGSDRQTAAGLASPQLLQLITSARPDWLSISIGLADAAREPDLPDLIRDYRAGQGHSESDSDDTIGPEYELGRRHYLQPTNGGRTPQATAEWRLLSLFAERLREAVGLLQVAGVRPILHTPIAVGHDLRYPINLALRAYGKAIREIADDPRIPLVDDERAFRDLVDRATTYKQRVALADWSGHVNPQGEALLARTFLNAFSLLPQPGFRSSS